MIGKSFHHYHVTEKIGAGGMGEVYRAGDSKLGRDVALKVLPEVFTDSAERMARFRREAQVLASLNHPNIAAIYGLEEVDGTHFLVLELVGGPTLADRLAQGAVPVEEALAIALQIAEAVESAHESGVIHRDLKPANVKVTPDDRVKVLDFGLAKALDDPAMVSGGGSQDPSASPTLSPTLSSPITGALTGANVILGTAAYMSPEQARGHSVDKRADIWAFGVVLFEMLTGSRLFDGETVSDTLAAVLRKDVPWDQLPAETPPRVRRLLRRCLERKPKDRLRDIGDARLAIREAMTEPPEETGEGAPVAAAPPAPRWRLPAIALGAAAVAFAAAWLLRPGPEPLPLRKYEWPFPQGTTLTETSYAADGSALAYVVNGTLRVREFETMEDRLLDERDGFGQPFWSPDLQWIAYGSEEALWKVRRSGGEPVRVAVVRSALDDLSSGVWRPDGTIYFTTAMDNVWQVSAQGGEPGVFAEPGEGATDFHEMADVGGRGLAAIVHTSGGIDTIDLFLDGERHRIVTYPEEMLTGLVWSPTGHLLFRRRGDAEGIWAVPLSAGSREVGGAAFLVTPLAHSPSVSANGDLACVRGGARGQELQLALVDREGSIRELVGDPQFYHEYPSVSPDGTQIANRIRDGDGSNLWLIDLDRGTQRRFTRGPGNHAWGSWSPDGRDFWYFDEQNSEEARILVMPANGTGEPRSVIHGQIPRIGAGGRWLIYNHLNLDDNRDGRDLYVLDLETPDAEPQPLVVEGGAQWVHAPSPTDPLVAYTADGSGRWEVYLTTFPDRTGDWSVSTGAGWMPQWRQDGRELYYAVGDSIMVVDVEARGLEAPLLSRPRLLFRRPRYEQENSGFSNGFDVLPDGETFLTHVVPEGVEDRPPPSIVLTQNWWREFQPGGASP